MQESSLLLRKKKIAEDGLILDISARTGSIVDAMGRSVTVSGVGINNAIKPTGPVMTFGGTAYLTVPNTDESLWLLGDFCIDFWVYLVARNKPFPCYFGNYDAWPNGNGLQLFAGHASGNVNRHNAAIAGVFPAYNGSINLAYGVWRHYATERKGSVITTYVNGAVDATATSNKPLHGSKSRIVIGAASDDVSSGLTGYIERYRIFNGVRYGGAFTPEQF